jgi:hypothetical protein
MAGTIHAAKDPPFAARHPMGKKNKMEGARGKKSSPVVKKVTPKKGIRI